MVFFMANIGAVTRLTESGLSITYWEPVKGAVPPLSDADWTREFDRYQASPQFQKVNQGMALGEFRHIFWWEWVHRQWGRLIGLVYAAGLIWFWLRGNLSNKARNQSLSLSLQEKGRPESFMLKNNLKLKLFGVLCLGGLQGAVGWYMVKSGLINDPAVSHYRLAAHLLLAAALYVCLIWLALSATGMRRETLGIKDDTGVIRRTSRLTPLYKHGVATLCILMVTITYGAFVAGLRAGLVYNSWPLMGGSYVPPDFWYLQPAWRNVFENHAAVQFIHRNLAYLTALMGLALAVQGWRKAPTHMLKKLAAAIGGMVLLQASLGIMTILTQVQIHVAVAHQAGAFLLLGLLVSWLYFMRRAIQQAADRHSAPAHETPDS